MSKENLTLISLVLALLLGTLVVNNVFLTERITQKVIDRLKRDYVPGPYEPGFDPDKVPPRKAILN
jgi:hypothetical protein